MYVDEATSKRANVYSKSLSTTSFGLAKQRFFPSNVACGHQVKATRGTMGCSGFCEGHDSGHDR